MCALMQLPRRLFQGRTDRYVPWLTQASASLLIVPLHASSWRSMSLPSNVSSGLRTVPCCMLHAAWNAAWCQHCALLPACSASCIVPSRSAFVEVTRPFPQCRRTRSCTVHAWTVGGSSDAGNLSLAKQYLAEDSSEAHLNERDADGRTPLHWAASGNDKLDIVKALFAAGPVHVDERDGSSWTPLMIASSAGADRVVDFLLEQYVPELTQWRRSQCEQRAQADRAALCEQQEPPRDCARASRGGRRRERAGRCAAAPYVRRRANPATVRRVPATMP